MSQVTSKKPTVSPEDLKRTRIVATVGPATHSYERIYELISSGVNGIRLNFSHGDHQEKAEVIKWVRKASEEYGKPVAIIQDLQGPKIRLGEIDGELDLKKGQELRLSKDADYERTAIVPIQYDISERVKRGHRLFMYDGRICSTVTSVKDGVVSVSIENDGQIMSRKGINLPDTDFSGATLTDKDLEDLGFGATQDIDYVALSFVQTEDDLHDLRRRLKNLGSEARVICKLETRVAAERLESIVKASDAVMIARGDLAYEVGPEAVPLIQREAISLCHKHAKQSIVATQMLIGMVDSPEPTRAEVSDVSTAVILGADAVMLSDETTIGTYPIETVKVMKRIVRYNEVNKPLNRIHPPEGGPAKQTAICAAIVSLADQVNATAIVAETKSGATAYHISSHQPHQPVIAVTSSLRVAQQLSLTRGVMSFVRRDSKTQTQKLTAWLRTNNVLDKGDVIVSVSGQYPGVVGATDTIKVRILE
ncbi:MAG: pyruvate kinase [Patescibacteria group bacterium]